jgi:hypothetical protein
MFVGFYNLSLILLIMYIFICTAAIIRSSSIATSKINTTLSVVLWHLPSLLISTKCTGALLGLWSFPEITDFLLQFMYSIIMPVLSSLPPITYRGIILYYWVLSIYPFFETMLFIGISIIPQNAHISVQQYQRQL